MSRLRRVLRLDRDRVSQRWRQSVLAILQDIASAVNAAHRQGLIHRDLKPENLFLVPQPDGELTKVLDVARRGAGLGVRYAVRAERAIAARLAVRWNLTLSGPGLERYYRGEDGEIGLLEAAGEREGERVALVDDWLGLTATLTWSPRARILWTPVYTVSLSETGLERVWQGVELTVVWPLELGPDGWEGRMGLGLEAHRKGA